MTRLCRGLLVLTLWCVVLSLFVWNETENENENGNANF